ncbi:response regulator [bacterium]|nr:response regulator [bacterium]
MTKKILIIEDSPTILDLKCAILEEAGFETIRAAEAMEGIQLLRAHDPDLVLLDLRLPDMDGYQVCRFLKNDEASKDIPIVLATASRTEKKDEFWGLHVGADGYLREPFEPEELVDTVNRILGIGDGDKTT